MSDLNVKELIYNGCSRHASRNMGGGFSPLCENCSIHARAATVEILVSIERRLSALEKLIMRVNPIIEQHDCIQPIAYKVRRKNDGVEYGPFETLSEANVWVSEHNELICIYPGQEINNETSPQV